MKDQRILWEDHFKKGKFNENYPSEQVVRFVMRFIRQNGPHHRVLDLGCGVGRHLILCAENGLECYGMDLSSAALRTARSALKRKGLKAKLTQGSMDSLPYPDDFFDLVISYGVLDHVRMATAKKGMSEVFRILKDKGQLYLKLETSMSPERFIGKKVGKNTYVIKTECERDIIQHYFSKSEVLDLMRSFTIKRLEQETISDIVNKKLTLSRWHMIGEKDETDKDH